MSRKAKIQKEDFVIANIKIRKKFYQMLRILAQTANSTIIEQLDLILNEHYKSQEWRFNPFAPLPDGSINPVLQQFMAECKKEAEESGRELEDLIKEKIRLEKFKNND